MQRVALGYRIELPLDGYSVSLEPVWNENLVLLLVAEGQDVSPLDCLIKKPKDVIYGDDSLGGLLGTNNIY